MHDSMGYYFLIAIWHVVMFTVLCYNTNGSAFWWKIDIDFKYIIFDKGMILEFNFWYCNGGNICANHKFRTWWPSFAKFIVIFIKFCRIYNIWVSWCVVTTISLWLCCLCNLWMILLLLCHIDFRIWCDGLYITSKISKLMDASIFTIPWKKRWGIV